MADARVTELFPIREAGGTITEGPTNQPWGERDARGLDPEGNEILIGQRRSS